MDAVHVRLKKEEEKRLGRGFEPVTAFKVKETIVPHSNKSTSSDFWSLRGAMLDSFPMFYSFGLESVSTVAPFLLLFYRHNFDWKTVLFFAVSQTLSLSLLSMSVSFNHTCTHSLSLLCKHQNSLPPKRKRSKLKIAKSQLFAEINETFFYSTQLQRKNIWPNQHIVFIHDTFYTIRRITAEHIRRCLQALTVSFAS